MRAREFVAETTVSGSIATVAQPLGSVIRRNTVTPVAKYKNTLMKRRKQHVSK